MKRFIKFIGIILLVFIVIAGLWFAWLWSSSAEYRSTPAWYDTTLALTRTAKVVSRTHLESSQNGAMLQLWNTVYTIADDYSMRYIDSLQTDMQTYTVLIDDVLVDIQYPVSALLSGAVYIDTTADTITVMYDEVMIGRRSVVSSSGWNDLVAGGLYSMDEVHRLDGYVLTYEQGLDNPFTTYALEEVGDLAYVYDSLASMAIINEVEQLTARTAYLANFVRNENEVLLDIDPVQIYESTWAAEAFAQYDPLACQEVMSGNASDICMPANGIYIYNDTWVEDTLTLALSPSARLDSIARNNADVVLSPITLDQLENIIGNVTGTVFDIYYTSGTILGIRMR